MVISPRSRLNESVSVSDQMRSAKSGSSAVGHSATPIADRGVAFTTMF